MQMPAFDVGATPEPERRHPYAWTWLFIFFVALIALTLAGYFSRSKSAGENYQEVASTLKREMLVRGLRSQAGQGERTQLGSARGMVAMSTELVNLRKTKRSAAELYVAVRFEQGQKVTAQDVEPINRLSTKPEDRAFVQVYSADKLTLPEAQRLVDQLPQDPYVYKAARIHALEKAGVRDAISREIGTGKITMLIASYVLVFFALAAGIILWVVYLALRSSGQLTPLGHPAGVLSGADSDRMAVRVLQLMTLFIVLEVAAALLVPKAVPPQLLQFGTEFLLVLLLPLVGLSSIWGKRITARIQGWNREHLLKNIAWGLAAACANAPIVVILALVGQAVFRFLPQQSHPVELELTLKQDFLSIALISTIAAIFAPIFEETVFRGTFLPALAKRTGSIPLSIVITSLCFAMIHPTGPPSWFALAAIGAMSCCLTYQTRSLVPSLVMHATHNFVTLMLVLAIS